MVEVLILEPSDAIADLGFLLGDRLLELVECHTLELTKMDCSIAVSALWF